MALFAEAGMRVDAHETNISEVTTKNMDRMFANQRRQDAANMSGLLCLLCSDIHFCLKL
jgi:hypothetical protein